MINAYSTWRYGGQAGVVGRLTALAVVTYFAADVRFVGGIEVSAGMMIYISMVRSFITRCVICSQSWQQGWLLGGLGVLEDGAAALIDGWCLKSANTASNGRQGRSGQTTPLASNEVLTALAIAILIFGRDSTFMAALRSHMGITSPWRLRSITFRKG